MQNQSKAYLYALLAILFWSTMGTAFKLTLNEIPINTLLLISSLVAFFFLGLFCLLTGRFQLLRNLTAREIGYSALMGLFNPFLYYLVLFKAYSMIQAQEAVALNYIWPVMLVVFAMIFLKQKISLISILAILISFAGTFVIATHGNIFSFRLTNPLGTALATGSSLFWAAFFVLNMKDKRESYSKMFLNFGFGFLYIAIWNLIKGNIAVPSVYGLFGSIYIGIFEMGLTFVLWLTALNLSKTAAKVSNLVYLSPFISLMLVSIFVGEKILLSTIAGLLILVSGIILQQWSSYKGR